MKEFPYWWDTVPSPDPGGPQLDIPPSRRVDVAIIGAGYTGLAAARQLARAGASVVVLERERVGWGASSRNGGQVLTGLKLDAATLIARFGEAARAALFDVSIEAIATLERLVADEGLECEYERSGHIDAANKPSHFKAFRDEQSLLRAGLRSSRRARAGGRATRARSDPTRTTACMLDERSGALNPARYVEQLAAAASRAGAVIVEGARVTAVAAAEDVDTRPRIAVRSMPATCSRRPTGIRTAPFPGCSGGWCRSAATSSPPSR